MAIRELRIRQSDDNYFNVWNDDGKVVPGLTFEELVGLIATEFLPKGGVPYRTFIHPDEVKYGLLNGDTGHGK